MKSLLIFLAAVTIILTGSSILNCSRSSSSNIELAKMLDTLPPVSKDYTTPEGAILMLEDAYRNKDIEAAVSSKDFILESYIMLKKTNSKVQNDSAILKETAETLELSFRESITSAWPDFTGLKCYFVKREEYEKDIEIITEICRYPDSLYSEQKLLVAKTPNGWRVLNVLYE